MTTGNKQRITVFLNPLLSKQTRAQALVEEISFSELVGKALIAYLPQETVVKKPDLEIDNTA